MDGTLLLLLLTLAVVLFPRRVTATGPRRPAILGIGWLILLAVAVVTTVASALLLPKPKQGKPASADDIQNPTNDAGREMQVLFGEGVIKNGNILWFGDKGVRTYKVKA